MIKQSVWIVCLWGLYAGLIFAEENSDTDQHTLVEAMDLSGKSSQLETLLSGYYQNALGGSVNWEQIQSVRFHGLLELPQGVVEFIAYKKKPNYCKVVLFGAGQIRMVMATDGEDAWQLIASDSLEAGDMPAAEAINFQRDATIGGHLLYPNLPGKTIEFLGMEPVDSELCYRFKVTLPDRQVVEYFVDASRFTERRQVVTNAVSQQQEVITHFEHREVHGLQIPFRSVMSVDGKQVHVVRLLEVDVNLGVTSWMFARGSAAYFPNSGRSTLKNPTDNSMNFSVPRGESGMESSFQLPAIDATQREQLLQDLELEL